MYVLLSPAKKMTEGARVSEHSSSELELAGDIQQLLKITATMRPNRLKKLMGISDALAELNAERFGAMQWPMTPDKARQAALLFAGDTYQGLDAASLSAEDLNWAQDHLGILSGLYGLLRPLDLIQPYRLEMGTSLKNHRGKDLYAFWGDRLANLVDQRVAGHPQPVVINCASNEYFKAAGTKALKAKVITPIFLEQKGDTAKTISFLAKKARGAMARYIVVNRLTKPEQMQDFDQHGYCFDTQRSTVDKPAFVAQRG
jgi:cytoplasmic iron level regulating protein YaaA (DUF328/UPF0246 family)